MKREQDHLDIRPLNAFVRLAHARSFHLAAQQLGVSTSALSQTIRHLENELGQPLFDRASRPVSLTRFAEHVLPEIQRLVDEARTLQQRLRAFSSHTPQNLRLGCVDSFAATVGPALIRGLDNHENTLQLYSGLTPDISRQFEDHQIDFAVSTDPMADLESIHCVSLFQESWLAVYPKQRAPQQLRTTSELIEAGKDMDFVRYSLRSRIGAQIERYTVHHSIKARRRFEFDATDTLLNLVAAGMGWAISSPLCLLQSRHNIEAVEVVELSASIAGTREFYLLWRNDAPLEQADLLVRMIRQIVTHSIAPAIRAILPHFKVSPIHVPAQFPALG